MVMYPSMVMKVIKLRMKLSKRKIGKAPHNLIERTITVMIMMMNNMMVKVTMTVTIIQIIVVEVVQIVQKPAI